MTHEISELSPTEVKFMVEQALQQFDRADLSPDDVIHKHTLECVSRGGGRINNTTADLGNWSTDEVHPDLDAILGPPVDNDPELLAIDWQYFRPGERPQVTFRGRDERSGKIKLQINDGRIVEYEQVNRIDDVYHMQCRNIHIQVKRHNNFGICDDLHFLRAASRSYIEHHAEELGAGKIQIEHGLSQSSGLPQYSAHSGIRGTSSYVEEVSVTLEPVNITQSDALALIDKLLDVHRATELDSDSYSIRYNGNHLEVSTAAGANTANAVQWFEAIRFHVNSHWISRVSDDCFDTTPF